MSFSSDFNLWCAFYNKWQPQMDTGESTVILKLHSNVVNILYFINSDKQNWWYSRCIQTASDAIVSFPKMPQKTIVVNWIRHYFLVTQNDSVVVSVTSLPYFVCLQYKAPEQQV